MHRWVSSWRWSLEWSSPMDWIWPFPSLTSMRTLIELTVETQFETRSSIFVSAMRAVRCRSTRSSTDLSDSPVWLLSSDNICTKTKRSMSKHYKPSNTIYPWSLNERLVPFDQISSHGWLICDSRCSPNRCIVDATVRHFTSWLQTRFRRFRSNPTRSSLEDCSNQQWTRVVPFIDTASHAHKHSFTARLTMFIVEQKALWTFSLSRINLACCRLKNSSPRRIP